MISNLNPYKITSILLYSVLLIFLRIDLVITNTLPTGGDMGAHVVPVKFFVESLITNFQISGWSSDWFAGYPAFYFYFPLPPLIVSFFSIAFPFNVSFKLMVIFSLILLVISIDCLLNKKQNSTPFLGFAAGVSFLLTESFTIFGGNLASTLAGQYSYTYSMAFGNLAIYFLTKSGNKNRNTLSAVMIAACLLSHIIPFIFYSIVYFIHFIISVERIRLKLISTFLFLALTLRFSTSLLFNLEFTTNMTYSPYTKLSDLIKPDVLPYIFLIFIFFSIKKQFIQNLKLFSFELYLIFFSVVLFFYGPEGALWNGRLVPFFNLGLIMLFFKLLSFLLGDIQNKEITNYVINKLTFFAAPILLFIYYEKWQDRYLVTSVFICFLLLVLFLINFSNTISVVSLSTIVLIFASITFLPHWLNWNFTGYESKENWSEINNLYQKLNKLEPGRIMWEPNSDMNKYGTPMVLMTIPLFTEHESVEGLYFDSSITTPFHFVSVSGLAESPSNPVGGLRYINGNFEKGEKFMKELGVDYFISYTDSIKDKALSSSSLKFLFESEPFTVFQLESNKIELLDSKLIEYQSTTAVEGISGSIFRDISSETFAKLSMDEFMNELDYRYIEGLKKSDFVDLTSSKGLNIKNLSITNSTISFSTNLPNQLHLIKVSYFPNWEIINGEGPFRVSPSFMAVIPYDNEVVLKFTNTRTENIFNIISIIFLIFSVTLAFLNKKNEPEDV